MEASVKRVLSILDRIPDAVGSDPDVRFSGEFIVVVCAVDGRTELLRRVCTLGPLGDAENPDDVGAEPSTTGTSPEPRTLRYIGVDTFLDIFEQRLPAHTAYSRGLLHAADMPSIMLAKRVFDAVRRLDAGSGGAQPPPPNTSVALAGPAKPSPPAEGEGVSAAVGVELDALQARLSELTSTVRSLQEESAAAGVRTLHAVGWGLTAALVGSLVTLIAAVPSVPVRAVSGVLLACSGYCVAAPGSGPSRRLRAFWTAGVVLLGLKRLRTHTAGMRDADSDAVWAASNRVYARFAFEAMLSLRGLWLKVGQYLSSRSDVVPAEYVGELAKLQDSAASEPWSVLAPMVAREWGCPVSEVLSHVEDAALASASIAQVHRAKLARPALVKQPVVDKVTGALTWTTVPVTDVVVKVQHPGIDRIMSQDLWTLGSIVKLIAWLEPEYDFKVVLDEWSKEAHKELDFAREAALTRHAGQLLSSAGLPVRVPLVVGLTDATRVVPGKKGGAAAREEPLARSVPGLPAALAKPFPILDTPCADDHPSSLATRHVILAEFIPGVKVTDMEAGPNRAVVMTDIIHAFALLMQVRGVFSGDPHPGNILVVGSTAVLLDFGLSKVLSPRERHAFALMSAAADTAAFDALLDSFDIMGLKMNRESPEDDLNAIQFALRDTVPRAEARARMMERRDYWQKKEVERKAAKLKRPFESFPAGLLFYFRAINLLQGLGAGLDARSPFMATLASYSRAALRAGSLAGVLHTPLGRLEESQPGSWLKYAALLTAAVRADPGAPVSLPRHVPPLGPSLADRLLTTISDLRARGEVTGLQVAVVQHGKVLVNVCGGELGPMDARPMTTSTLVNAFSVTKGVTATILHAVLQEVARVTGAAVGYDTPVADVWPDFAARVVVPEGASPRVRALAAAKAGTTIRHVLTHSTGLAHALPAGVSLPKLADVAFMMGAMEEAVPITAPGRHQSYHYYSFGWLCAGVCRGLSSRLPREAGTPFSMQGLLERYVLPALPEVCKSGMFIGLPSTLLPEELAAATDETRAPVLGSDRVAQLSGSSMGGGGAGRGTGSGGAGGGMDPSRIEAALRQMEAAKAKGEEDGVLDDASADAHAMLELLSTLRTRAYIMDPRLFNRRTMRAGEVPAANGHFTALALASFYGALGQPLAVDAARRALVAGRDGGGEGGKGDGLMSAAEAVLAGTSPDTPVLPLHRLVQTIRPHKLVVTSPPAVSTGGTNEAASALQRMFANDGSTAGASTNNTSSRLSFGLGYHIYGQPPREGQEHHAVFGHSGLGGSVALYCGPADAGVAVLVNQLSSTKGPTRAIIKVIEEHVQGMRGTLGVF